MTPKDEEGGAGGAGVAVKANDFVIGIVGGLCAWAVTTTMTKYEARRWWWWWLRQKPRKNNDKVIDYSVDRMNLSMLLE